MAENRDNEVERKRWNDEHWVAVWPRRERMTTAVTDLLLEHLSLKAGERVLDVGTGGGVAALAAAERVGESGSVVGADLSVPLVELATRRAGERGLGNVRFLSADVQSDPIEGAPFNVAMSQFGVMFFDEPVKAFANIRAQVGDGGRLGFVCWRPPEENPWFFGPALAPFVTPPPEPAPGKSLGGPFTLADPDHTIGVLTDADWSEINWAPYARNVTIEVDALFDDAQLKFLGVADEALDDARAAVETHLAPIRRGDGLMDARLSFQIFTATR